MMGFMMTIPLVMVVMMMMMLMLLMIIMMIMMIMMMMIMMMTHDFCRIVDKCYCCRGDVRL